VKLTIPKEEVIVLTEFLTESTEHLEGIEDKVLKMEVSRDIQLINSIFRPIHTVKGSSSFLGLEYISQLSHELETLLDDIRKGRIAAIDSDVIDIILESVDTLGKMLENTASAFERVDSSADVVVIDIPEIDYQSVMQRVVRLRLSKSSEASPIAGAAGTADGDSGESIDGDERRNIDYDGIVYPAEMKLQFVVEGLEQVSHIENILLSLEKNPQNIDLYNNLFRALHTLKGNTGVILSTIDDEKIRKQHFLNQFRRIAHAAESFVQKKRDARRAFNENEIEILLNAADCMKHDTRKRTLFRPGTIGRNFQCRPRKYFRQCR
jgi:two-component system chemotaxis sensor kinase CheA